MRAPYLLVTGFGPFPGVSVNPSATLAKRVASAPRLRRVLGTTPTLVILETSYSAISTTLDPALALEPDAVLMIGVARRATRIRVEGRAINRASRLSPDASGKIPYALTLEANGPPARRSGAARYSLVILQRVGAVASRDAGRYLCNANYYRVLSQRCPAVFLHIPPLLDPSRPRRSSRAIGWNRLDARTDAFIDVAVELLTWATVRGNTQERESGPLSGTPTQGRHEITISEPCGQQSKHSDMQDGCGETGRLKLPEA